MRLTMQHGVVLYLVCPKLIAFSSLRSSEFKYWLKEERERVSVLPCFGDGFFASEHCYRHSADI